MKIAIGSDHRGFEIKQKLVELVRGLGHDVADAGPPDTQSVDYPDYAFQVAEMVATQSAQRGVLICGTGIGMSIAANKVPGIRAALCLDPVTAGISRRHNDANVLCLGGDLITADQAVRILRVWIKTEFDGGRHSRRLQKIEAEERQRDNVRNAPPT